MTRWFLLIQESHPHIRHIPEKSNILADILSRAGCSAQMVKSETPEDEILIESLCAIEATLSKNETGTLYVNSPFQITELANAQDNDHLLGPIKAALINIRAKYNLPSGLSSYFLEGEVLHKTLTILRLGKITRLPVVCVPDKVIKATCHAIHVHSAHAGKERALIEAERLIHHPQPKAERKKEIEGCPNCLKDKSQLKPLYLHFCSVPSAPFQEVSLKLSWYIAHGSYKLQIYFCDGGYPH